MAKGISQIFTFLFLVAFIGFIFYLRKADAAMGKGGIGDVEQFEAYSSFAGICFWSAAASWLLSLVFVHFSPQPYRGRAMVAWAVIAPIVFLVGYFGSLAL
jgi:hypothetical protein